jgi:mRNA interferase MazF
MTILRGEIYQVDLDPVRGSEIRKKRPAVIVSSDAINRSAAVVIVCPLTDHDNKFSPIHIEIPGGEGGLSKGSVAHCGQVRAIDKERLGNKLGSIDRFRMAQISKGLKIALDITF